MRLFRKYDYFCGDMYTITYNHLNLPHTISGTSGERACSSHTKWLVGEVKRNVRPASRYKIGRGAAMKSKHFERQPKCFCGKIERITGTTYEYQYYIKDHLGNVRVVFKSGPTLISEHHFYPLGERIRSSHTKRLVDEVKRSFRPTAQRCSNGGPNKAQNSSKTNVVNKIVCEKGVNHGNIQQKTEGLIKQAINQSIQNY